SIFGSGLASLLPLAVAWVDAPCASAFGLSAGLSVTCLSDPCLSEPSLFGAGFSVPCLSGPCLSVTCLSVPCLSGGFSTAGFGSLTGFGAGPCAHASAAENRVATRIFMSSAPPRPRRHSRGPVPQYASTSIRWCEIIGDLGEGPFHGRQQAGDRAE